MSPCIDIAIQVLIALLTGGFILLFVETMHIEGSVKRDFKAIMNPFYHRLSLLVRFIAYMRSDMEIPNEENGYSKRLREDLNKITRIGVEAQVSGRDIFFMSSTKLHHLCELINDVWYVLEKDRQLYEIIKIRGNSPLKEGAVEALEELYPKQSYETMDVKLLWDATGSFYINDWQPVESCTDNYEIWENKARVTRLFIYMSMAITMLFLIVLMFWVNRMNLLFPQTMVCASTLFFAVSILRMSKLVSLSHKLFRQI